MIPCPEWMEAFLEHIEAELERVMWNKNQKEFPSPFRNTGNAFDNDTFLVKAYDWGWDFSLDDYPSPATPPPQPVNFQWRDIEIRWYKTLNRGTELNRVVSPHEGVEMLDDCISSLREGETYD